MRRERATRTSKPFAWLACVFVMAFAQTTVATCTLGVTDVTFGDYDMVSRAEYTLQSHDELVSTGATARTTASSTWTR